MKRTKPQLELWPPRLRREPVGLQETLEVIYWRFKLMAAPPVDDMAGERLDNNNLEFPCK